MSITTLFAVSLARDLSSREFNQDVSKAKLAARLGPAIITDRGKPAHVLLSYLQYQQLSQLRTNIADLLTLAPHETQFDADFDFDVLIPNAHAMV